MLKKSLAETHPEVAKEWHPSKNGELTPNDFTGGSHKKVWWKCPKGDDHEWETSLTNRTRLGRNCTICSNQKIVKSNCLATTNPKLASQWHPTLNGNLTPSSYPSGSGKKVWWKCPKGDDHEWESRINHITNGSGCPICSGRKVVESNCIATTHTELAKEWHPTLNGDLTPKDVVSGTAKKVWWKCDKGDDHEWKASINQRASGSVCPICSNRKTVESNSLAITHPLLAKEWHPTLNGNLTPFDVMSGSHKKVWWKCDKGDDHEWKTTMSDRSNGRDCPFCTLTPQSKQELTITFELMKLFKNINPKGLKTKLDGRLRAIDIFIPKLNLCIEFDGAYWHKEKRDIDKIKSEMLFEEGFKLIRVREEPLKKIYDTDVTSKKPYNGKQVTNNILSMIMSIFELDAKLVSKIKEYQSKDGLKNEKGLEKYIDKILTEKAEKK
jgi:cytochrome c-type biogenesis protein CcmH/NrfF